MIRNLIVLIMFCGMTLSAYSWAYLVESNCPVGQPGPGYSTCYWMDEGGMPVPGSNMCDEGQGGKGGCITAKDCHNALAPFTYGPCCFPYSDIGPLVPIIFWVI